MIYALKIDHMITTRHLGFIYVIVSKSMKTKPANCDILTADYSFKEMMDILSGDEYKGKIGNIIVLGGVPLYNTMMAKDFKYKSRWNSKYTFSFLKKGHLFGGNHLTYNNLSS